jgi:hypothetical protein
MADHTPGPWTVEPVDLESEALEPGGSGLPFFIAAPSTAAFDQWGLMGDFRGTRVAYVACNPAASYQPEWARVEANARLIAAAPDLLDACERLLKFNENLCEDVGVSKHYPSADNARRLIARVRGA